MFRHGFRVVTAAGLIGLAVMHSDRVGEAIVKFVQIFANGIGVGIPIPVSRHSASGVQSRGGTL